MDRGEREWTFAFLLQKCEEEEEGRKEGVIDPADRNWSASGDGGGGKKGRNYCGAWEDDRATFATVCMRRCSYLGACLLSGEFCLLVIGNFVQWVSRPKPLVLGEIKGRRCWSRKRWMRRRRVEGAGLVKLWDFKIRMRRVKLLTCMEEKGGQCHWEESDRQEDWWSRWCDDTDVNIVTTNMNPALSCPTHPPPSPSFNVSFRHPFKLCWGRSIQGRWQESALWREDHQEVAITTTTLTTVLTLPLLGLVWWHH